MDDHSASVIREDHKEDRHVSLSLGGMSDIHQALAWAVQRYDREFTGASMVKISIEQYMVCDTETGDEWRYTWSAAVSGSFESNTPEPLEER
jgi:hypothetical protein